MIADALNVIYSHPWLTVLFLVVWRFKFEVKL